MSTVSVPTVASTDGQPCATCRAPLAGDQRYCLQCGTRRADAPGTSLDALVAAGTPGISQTPGVAIVAGQGQVQLAPAPVAAAAYPYPVGAGGAGYGGPPAPPTGAKGWIRSNGPFLSLGSFAVGVLIVGLLIGHWSTEQPQAVAPAPTTTKIEITGLSAAPAAAAADTASTDSSSGDSSSSDASDSSSKDASKSDPTATPVIPKGAVAAKDLTPAEVEKAGKKGATIVTTGKKVPKDNKPAGGGSATVDIG